MKSADGDAPAVSRDAFTPLLCRLTSILDETLDACPSAAQDARSFVQSGKRLRARLMFAAADGAPRSHDDDLVRCAAAIELIHSASLLHDDIVDRSVERRGLKALHNIHGVRPTALTGVCLVHLALELIAPLADRVRRCLARAGRELARGQFTEIVRRLDVGVGPAERIIIMKKKTGSIFGLSCELGGLLTGSAPIYSERLRRVGAAFGVLYQIADDVDDIFGVPDELGREPGADLLEGVISLPIAIALRTEHQHEVKTILSRYARRSTALARCREILVRSGALQRSYDIASIYRRTAQRHLAQLPRTTGTRWIAHVLETTVARITRHIEASSMALVDGPAHAPTRQAPNRGLIPHCAQ